MCIKYTLFYESPNNWGYYVHVKTVCTRPLLGEEGLGDEATKCAEKSEQGPCVSMTVGHHWARKTRCGVEKGKK